MAEKVYYAARSIFVAMQFASLSLIRFSRCEESPGNTEHYTS